MTNNDQLITGFSINDTNRISTHLTKLLPYIDTNKMAIVGGLAIRYFLNQSGLKYPVRPFNDLDIKVEKADVVSPQASKEFLVYHYHPPKKGSFYIVLVDPTSKTKVDIFDWNPPVESYITVNFAGYKLKLQSIEDQLVKTVYDIQRISAEANVDPKQFKDTRLLMRVADMDLADKIWKKRNYKNYPKSIYDAIQRAEKIATDHSEWIKEHPFKKPQPYKCEICQDADGFKVEDMRKIYKVLGYVE